MSATGASGIAPITDDGRRKRPSLDVETERSVHLLRRLGQRARRWLIAHEEELTVVEIIGRTEQGEPIEREVVVPADVIDAVKVHAKGVVDLLREQRERAKLKPLAPVLSDAEFETELRELALETLRTLPQEEFERLALARGAIDATAVDTKPEDKGDW